MERETVPDDESTAPGGGRPEAAAGMAAADARDDPDGLRRSRDQLRLALDAARMGVWEWDVATGDLTWSDGLEAVHGMRPGSFDGTFASFIAVVHPDDRDALAAQIQAALEGGDSFATEFRAVGHDGAVRWVSGEGRVIRDPAGTPTHMIGVGRDITRQRRMEDALRESEARFRAMADSAPVMIWVTDAGGDVTYLSAGWLRFTGRSADEELGRGWLAAVHPEDRDRCEAAYRDAAARGIPFEMEFRQRRADGEWRWVLVHGSPRVTSDGRLEGFIGSSLDITERHRGEEGDRLVAEIGVLLTGPLSLDERLRSLAGAVLPRIADMCVVDLRDAAGELQRVAVAHVDPDTLGVLRELPAPPPGTPVAEASEHGRSILLPEVPEELYRDVARSAEELELRRRLTLRSAVIAPLHARGEQIGAMTVATSHAHSGRTLDDRDLRVVERIAVRAALAIDNARLFEAERSLRQRAQRLARASEILGSSLDLDRTLQALAEVVVPDLADWCTVHLAEEGGPPRRVALAHADPAKIRWAEELSDRYPPDPDSAQGVPAVIRSGRPELVPHIPEELIAGAARDPEHLRLIREVGLLSYICVPLMLHGRPFGALTMIGTAESGRRFGAEDLDFAREMAGRAASAIGNARLYRTQRDIASTLQKALLPHSLPRIDGGAVAAEYIAMGDGVEIGGDFYDVFPDGRGGWLVVVGDVCGKGPEAAALTAMARYTLQALAPAHPEPAGLIVALNAAMRRHRPGDTRFLTLCLASVRAAAGGLRLGVACAGHPPPVVVGPRGDVRAVRARGSIVGVLPEVEVEQERIDLFPGDRIVIHTDGATEARSPSGAFLGEEGVAAAAAALAGRDVPDMARGIADAVVAWVDGRLRDDLAILVLGAEGAGGG